MPVSQALITENTEKIEDKIIELKQFCGKFLLKIDQTRDAVFMRRRTEAVNYAQAHVFQLLYGIYALGIQMPDAESDERFCSACSYNMTNVAKLEGQMSKELISIKQICIDLLSAFEAEGTRFSTISYSIGLSIEKSYRARSEHIVLA